MRHISLQGLVFQNEVFIFISLEEFPICEEYPFWEVFPSWDAFPSWEVFPVGKCASWTTIWRNSSQRHQNKESFPEGYLLKFCQIFTPGELCSRAHAVLHVCITIVKEITEQLVP